MNTFFNTWTRHALGDSLPLATLDRYAFRGRHRSHDCVANIAVACFSVSLVRGVADVAIASLVTRFANCVAHVAIASVIDRTTH